ncbi:MAG: hypothetical protein V4733_09730 [Verrucomicrobiota bacterium]
MSTKAKKAAKKAAKKTTARKRSGMRGKRYSVEEKQEIIDFVIAYNAENGRGGQSAAVKKYGLSALTVGAWLKKGGNAGKGGRITSSFATIAINKKVSELIDLGDSIRKAEVELEKLRARYSMLSSNIRSSI